MGARPSVRPGRALCALGLLLSGGCFSSIDLDLIPPAGSDPSDGGLPTNMDASLDASVVSPTCPEDMVPVAASTPFCIDATEVTATAYGSYLAAPRAPLPHPRCRFNDSRADLPAVAGPNLPMRGLDWCDAAEYCAWAGKRLCGRIGGGTLATQQAANPAVSEFAAACSNQGTLRFPYGDSYDDEACNGESSGPVDVGSAAGCVSIAGAFDLSGNVEEWVDACDANQNGSEGAGSGGQDPCAAVGGSYASVPEGLSCSSAPTVERRREVAGLRGFRCCL